MSGKTMMRWSFYDRNDAKGSEDWSWTNNTIIDIKLTGRWRFRSINDTDNKMEIEVSYTQVTKGNPIKKVKIIPFLPFVREENGKKEEVQEKGRIAWVDESNIRFITIDTYECTNISGEYSNED